MNKEIKKIFLVLFFFALSGGVFYNFEELWMANNNMSTKTIGVVFSLCALLSVSVMFLCSNLVNRKKLRKFSCALLLIKTIVLFALFILYKTGLNPLIKFLVMLDYVVDVEIYASIYPMISNITKNNRIYAIRGIVYTFAYYAGALLTSVLLGKTIMALKIDFNTYCLIGSVLMFIAFLILSNTDLEKYYKKEKESKYDAFGSVIKKVKNDKVSQNYLLFILFGDTSYNCINGLLILLLTTNLGFSVTAASYIKLGAGIATVFVSALILNKLTSKNDYINLSIKYVGRLILYILALLTGNRIIFLITIIYVRLLSEAYTHVTDAPYINRFNPKDQLALCNLKAMTSYFAKSIGNLLCGIALTLGVKFNFIFAIVFIIIQLYFGFKALYLRNHEKGDVVL